MDFADMVTHRLDELGENINSFEAKMGWKQGFLRAFVRNDSKRSSPTLDKAEVILEALGLELYFGAPRDEAPVQIIGGQQSAEFVYVPLHEATLSAGGGAQNYQEAVVNEMPFRRDWLRKIGVAPSAARLAHVQGDSMSPTISAGDMILIDTNRRDVPVRPYATAEGRHRAPIYALREPEGALVKRLFRPKRDELMLISDNTNHLPRLMPTGAGAELEIIGRVVWWGHTARE